MPAHHANRQYPVSTRQAGDRLGVCRGLGRWPTVSEHRGVPPRSLPPAGATRCGDSFQDRAAQGVARHVAGIPEPEATRRKYLTRPGRNRPETERLRTAATGVACGAHRLDDESCPGTGRQRSCLRTPVCPLVAQSPTAAICGEHRAQPRRQTAGETQRLGESGSQLVRRTGIGTDLPLIDVANAWRAFPAVVVPVRLAAILAVFPCGLWWWCAFEAMRRLTAQRRAAPRRLA